MYTTTNYKSKAALKRALAAGEVVTTFQPGGMFEAKQDGRITLEGPHYPAPHTWYASATIVDGYIVKVS